jgi:VanZ family protein
MKSKNLHVGGGGRLPLKAHALAWLPTALLAAAQFIASSVPGSNYPQVGLPHLDKVVHFSVYAAIGAACARGLMASFGKRGFALVALAAVLVIGYGATDEVHQIFVPQRSCDWHDLVADGAGAVAGAAFFARFLARFFARAKGAPEVSAMK